VDAARCGRELGTQKQLMADAIRDRLLRDRADGGIG
jgi:hypothetical protein